MQLPSAIILATAALLAGCGGGDGDEANPIAEAACAGEREVWAAPPLFLDDDTNQNPPVGRLPSTVGPTSCETLRVIGRWPWRSKQSFYVLVSTRSPSAVHGWVQLACSDGGGGGFDYDVWGGDSYEEKVRTCQEAMTSLPEATFRSSHKGLPDLRLQAHPTAEPGNICVPEPLLPGEEPETFTTNWLVDIKNVGPGASPRNFQVKVEAPRVRTIRVSLARGLEPGEWVDLGMFVPALALEFPPGAALVADPSNAVHEAKESNNRLDLGRGTQLVCREQGG